MHTTDFGGRGSAAYDLERFRPRQRRIKKPTLKVAKPTPNTAARARARAHAMMTLRLMAGVLTIAAVLVAMLYSRVVLTELNAKISAQHKLLAEAVTETTRLNTELEAKMSLRNVEEYATQRLGMTPADKSQITYVDLSEGDKVELTKNAPKQNLVDKIRLSLSQSQEYPPES